MTLSYVIATNKKSNSIHICLVFCLWHGSWVFGCINFFVCWLKDYTKTTRDFHETWMEDGSQPRTDPINFNAAQDKGSDLTSLNIMGVFPTFWVDFE